MDNRYSRRPAAVKVAAVLLVSWLVALAVTEHAGAEQPSSAAAGPGTIAFTRTELSKDKDRFGHRLALGDSVWLARGNGTRERVVADVSQGQARWLDGGRRLEVFGGSGRGEWFTIRRNGRDKRVVTFCVRQNRYTQLSRPEWSPDGRRFTFEYFSRAIDNTLNYLQSASGCPARQLPELGPEHLIPPPDERTTYALKDSPPNLTGPIWSPDGRTLAIGGGLPRSATYVLSPDGVARYVENPAREGVWLMNPDDARDSAAIRTLATWPAEVVAGSAVVGWSPDGNHVAVAGSGLFIVDTRTGTVRELLSWDESRGQGFEWSPDGRYIGWWRTRTLAGRRPILRNFRYDIYVVDVQTGALRNLTRFGCRDPSSIAWSPDGRRVAFSSGCRPQGIWTVSLSGKFTRLTRGFDQSPAWTAR